MLLDRSHLWPILSFQIASRYKYTLEFGMQFFWCSYNYNENVIISPTVSNTKTLFPFVERNEQYNNSFCNRSQNHSQLYGAISQFKIIRTFCSFQHLRRNLITWNVSNFILQYCDWLRNEMQYLSCMWPYQLANRVISSPIVGTRKEVQLVLTEMRNNDR